MSMKAKDSTYLSKSLFMKGLQCYKALYLHKFHPELRDEVSEAQEARFQSGREVGTYARQLFPGGFEVSYEDLSMEEQLNLTGEKIKGGARILYEPAFSYDNVFVKADILRKARQGWELYEVKGSTGRKDVYLDDVAVQYYVLKGAGIRISKASVVFLNKQYVRNSAIDPSKLFVIDDVTNTVRDKQRFVADEIASMRKALGKRVPDIDIGERCTKPYDCAFYGHCRQHIPEYSVFNLDGRGRVKPLDLYRQGIVDLRDAPKEILSKKQNIQLNSFLQEKEYVNKAGLKQFLDSLWYPLYFLDFETFSCAIPTFSGTRPYQNVPHQYSLHHLKRKGARLGHRAFLAEPNIDPREELARNLVSEIPDNACVLAYHASFEIGRLKELAASYPRYRKKLQRIIKNVRDLEIPFKKKDVYHWKMKGSSSQKYVLPALVPQLSYEGMEISNGGMAVQAYFRTCESQDQSEIEAIRKALLDYCKLDTLGMVRILERLREMA
ncbi:MAG: DUF2779 domain-containing protein [Deltaproteobacteria bacterium]|nr:MAG: DUF2779 domain-containing protein [Deltaproteobacteria bacterium]